MQPIVDCYSQSAINPNIHVQFLVLFYSDCFLLWQKGTTGINSELEVSPKVGIWFLTLVEKLNFSLVPNQLKTLDGGTRYENRRLLAFKNFVLINCHTRLRKLS
jgi:hypothetical protein